MTNYVNKEINDLNEDEHTNCPDCDSTVYGINPSCYRCEVFEGQQDNINNGCYTGDVEPIKRRL